MRKYNFDTFQQAYDEVIAWVNRSGQCALTQHSIDMFIEAVDNLVEVLQNDSTKKGKK